MTFLKNSHNRKKKKHSLIANYFPTPQTQLSLPDNFKLEL